MSTLPYDNGFEPPAPVLPARIGAPQGEAGVLVPMLVDTGADCTVIPEQLVDALHLPMVDALSLAGVDGLPRRAPVHAARVEVEGFKGFVRVVALGREVILGRDILNRLRLDLEGPLLRLRVKRKSTPRSKPG